MPVLSSRRHKTAHSFQSTTATVFQRPNMCATTYHYTTGRSGFCCCRTATVEQFPSRTATTWRLRRTIPSGAKVAFVLLMAAAPCDFWFYGALY